MNDQHPSIEKLICSTAVLWKGTGLVRAIQTEQVNQTPSPLEAPNADIWKRTTVKLKHVWSFDQRLSAHGSIASTLLCP